ncbi:MAG: hypothetical protein ACOH2V_00330 [Candidatus Saccharimonadaceae bacterium]
MDRVIQLVGARVLHDLIVAYKNEEHYYLSDTINYMFNSEEDALFTTNENIFNYIRRLLADEYELEIIPVPRLFTGFEKFEYKDMEIKLTKKQVELTQLNND